MTDSDYLYKEVVEYLRANGFIAPKQSGSIGALWTHRSSYFRVPVYFNANKDSYEFKQMAERIGLALGISGGQVITEIFAESLPDDKQRLSELEIAHYAEQENKIMHLIAHDQAAADKSDKIMREIEYQIATIKRRDKKFMAEIKDILDKYDND